MSKSKSGLGLLVFGTALAAFASVLPLAARAEDVKKVQLNPQPEPPGITAAQIATVSTGPPKPPAVITKVTPAAPAVFAGAEVEFSVEGTGDCKRNRIDFGDGKTGSEYALVARKGQPSPKHAYEKAGTYQVKAYGLADPWAKLPAPPPPSQHACTGHATTQVVVKQGFVFKQIPADDHTGKPVGQDSWSIDGKTPTPTTPPKPPRSQ